MILPHTVLPKQGENLPSRRERRPTIFKLKKEKRKLERRLRHLNPAVSFDNNSTTAFGNYFSLATFKEAIGFKKMLSDTVTPLKHCNSTYTAVDLLDLLVDACLLGQTRFDHTTALRFDPGYLKIKDLDRFPSERRFRDLMSRCTLTTLEELRTINRHLIQLRSQLEGPKYVWLDIDDSVITLFGGQECAEVGYNPRYHGRPSLKAKVCFISETADLLHLGLYGGKSHILTDFEQFYEEALAQLPSNYVVMGIRSDCATMSEDTIERFEQSHFEYAVKMKMHQKLRTQICRITEDAWEDVDDLGDISVARMRYLPHGWAHAKDLVVVRQRIDEKNGQALLPAEEFYRYQAIMTNIEGPAVDVWRHYNKRCQSENLIDEIKNGFGVSENSQHEILRNQAFALVKAIAYNLMGWFKAVALPEEMKACKAETIRRRIICVPGNVVGNGWYRHIRLAPNKVLHYLIRKIKENLDRFLWFIVNGFQPLQI